MSLSIPSDLEQSNVRGEKRSIQHESTSSAKRIELEDQVSALENLSLDIGPASVFRKRQNLPLFTEKRYEPKCDKNCIHGLCFKCSALELGNLVSVFDVKTSQEISPELSDHPNEQLEHEMESFSSKNSPLNPILTENTKCSEICSRHGSYECSTLDLCRMTLECFLLSPCKSISKLKGDPISQSEAKEVLNFPPKNPKNLILDPFHQNFPME